MTYVTEIPNKPENPPMRKVSTLNKLATSSLRPPRERMIPISLIRSITLTYVEQVLESCLGTQSRYSAHRYIIRLREACAKAFPEIYGGNFERLLDIRKIAEEEFDVDKFINENYLPTEEEVKERLYSLI